ncbi:type IIL restriction-modification enzyme MmeI [Corynebacterium sp. NML 150383]|uniref:type IIL restriction-modification enzyme MmeI n=1 Tax=Corynebacterium sp. NML 150383 TaxID=2029400 RepID=UPI003511B6E2
MFMTWQRSVGGHLKSDLSFSNTLVWNTFSVPELVDSTRERITDVGKQVLEARALYPERSLADRYNPLAMSPELIKAMRIWIAGSTGRWELRGGSPPSVSAGIFSLLITPVWLKPILFGKSVNKFRDYKSPGCLLK